MHMNKPNKQQKEIQEKLNEYTSSSNNNNNWQRDEQYRSRVTFSNRRENEKENK